MIVLFSLILGLTILIIPILFYGKTISTAQLEFLKLLRRENEYLNIDDLYVNGNSATESKGKSFWLYAIDCLPEKTEKYFPEIEPKILNPHLYYAVVESDITGESIENDQPVYIVVYTMWGYKLIHLHFTDLPIMTLYADEDITENDTDIVFNEIPGKAHIRGNMARFFSKKSFKISLDKKTQLLDLRKDDDWILTSLYNDPERIRNVLGANLWYLSCAGDNMFEIANGYEYQYVELFINDYYMGLYALGYKPDQKQFEIDENEFLYSKNSLGIEGLELRGNKTKAEPEKAMAALKNVYAIDEKSYIDYWLFINFIAATDNFEKNYYFALKKDINDELYVVFCPWDLDLTWGNVWDREVKNRTIPYGAPIDHQLHMEGIEDGPMYEAYKEMMRDSASTTKIVTRYKELRESYWSDESLNSMINGYEKSIFKSGAYARDTSIWPDASNMDDPLVRLSEFRDYVFARAAWMDKYISELE